MTENNPELPEKIRQALKKSPALTPPESFYRGVLEKIERKSGRADEKSPAPPLPRSPAPWYWGFPAKSLATVCLLCVIVLVTRETQKTKPALFQSNAGLNEELPVSRSEPASAPLLSGAAGGKAKKSAQNEVREADKGERFGDLSNSNEVQSRLHRDISKEVGNPSPFDEIDAEAKRDLDSNRKDLLKGRVRAQSVPVEGNRPQSAAPLRAKEVLQARQNVSGSATQGSFLQEEKVMAFAKQQGPGTDAPALTARGLKSLGIAAANTERDWQGPMSGISAPRTIAVRSADEWAALWREHTQYIVPPPPVPDVDFATFMVVGVFAGAKSSAGYRTEIVDIRTLPDKVLVTYRETNPPAGMATAQVLTQPYHLRVVAKTSLPVTFQKVP